MTRKDYIRIASALQAAYTSYKPGAQAEREAVLEASKFIATSLLMGNQRFHYQHFLAVVRGEKALQSRPPRTRQARGRRDMRHKQPKVYCHDPRHGTPCPQPCEACKMECNREAVRDERRKGR